jgi:uncharacterized protein
MSDESNPGIWREEWKPLLWIVAFFVAFYWLPTGTPRFDGAVTEALALTKWYAREHVLLCLVPAFYIAGAISVFLNQQAVLRYLGPGAPKILAYGVASVSGTILAVCSCTVLPLFAGIYATGAGLGPATAFLYSGPAINVLAIVLTASVLGLSMGVARAAGAILFAIVIGLLMSLFFRRDEEARTEAQHLPEIEEEGGRTLGQNVLYFALMIGILVFANWGRPETQEGLWFLVYQVRWIVTSVLALGLGLVLVAWFGLGWTRFLLVAVPTGIVALLLPGNATVPFVVATVGLSVAVSTKEGELGDWFQASWGFTKQILPLLLAGILVAGFLLGQPGEEGIIPRLDRRGGGRELRGGKPLRLCGRSLHVLRHSHGGPHPPGAHGERDGKRPGPGPPAGGSRRVPSQHPGDQDGHWYEEDGSVHRPGDGHGHHKRTHLRSLPNLKET